MFKNIFMAAAVGMVAMSAFAVNMDQVEQSVKLKDGSTVYLFKDGKMGMENKFGKVVRMKEGHVMETADGQRVIMVGDEVARLESVMRAGNKK